LIENSENSKNSEKTLMENSENSENSEKTLVENSENSENRPAPSSKIFGKF